MNIKFNSEVGSFKSVFSFPIEKLSSCEVCSHSGETEKFQSFNLLISISFQSFLFDRQIKGVKISMEFTALWGCILQYLIVSLAEQLVKFQRS